MTGRSVEVGNIVWRWGSVVAMLSAAFFAGQYIGRSQSIAGNTYRIEQLERRATSIEEIARMVPLLVQRLESFDEWRRDIEQVREARNVRIGAIEANVSSLNNDITSIRRALERIEARLERQP